MTSVKETAFFTRSTDRNFTAVAHDTLQESLNLFSSDGGSTQTNHTVQWAFRS
ncbi:hypothetical protein KIN20_036989 [Parelaphostrongylus tenuis]|uniref:Uncharacterized protein n=1 Tax=Parelaphostrongylus tenuis TaxID=148309 RepID=A0AAD5RDR4_PARTN|nr:hypothetical protein KIN20_036989 [Parelaphostrongylus tenuis]